MKTVAINPDDVAAIAQALFGQLNVIGVALVVVLVDQPDVHVAVNCDPRAHRLLSRAVKGLSKSIEERVPVAGTRERINAPLEPDH